MKWVRLVIIVSALFLFGYITPVYGLQNYSDSHPVCCTASDYGGGVDGGCSWVTTNNSCVQYAPMGPDPPCPDFVQGHNIYDEFPVANSVFYYVSGSNYNCMYGCFGDTPTRCSTPYGYDACFNTSTDKNNCGGCGQYCDEKCVNGECVPFGGGDSNLCTFEDLYVKPGPGCVGTTCYSGSTILINYTYSGECTGLGYIVIYVNGTSADKSCKVQYQVGNTGIEGMYKYTSEVFPPHESLKGRSSFSYVIPNIPSNCDGKTISRWTVSASQFEPQVVFDDPHEYFGDAGSITFQTKCGNGIKEYNEQCDDGPTLNFGFWNPWNINFNRRCLENCQLNLCYIN